MKNRQWMKTLGDLVVGKGFYIVLFLCVATIGMSGYYLVRTLIPAEETPPAQTAGSASVALPLPGEGAPAPVITPPKEVEEVAAPAEVTLPDDPQPVKVPVPEERKTAAEFDPASAVFTWPVKGAVLRDFSVEALALDPTMGDWRTHGGLDIAAGTGIKVLAIAPGRVLEVYEDGLMGTTVTVDHGGGLSSRYCGLAVPVTVAAGDRVETGTVVGTVGDTAIAESGMEPHLHLEVWKDGTALDPAEFLPEK